MTDEQIYQLVCNVFEVTKKQIKSNTRKSKVVLARMELCYLFKKIKGYSVQQIIGKTQIQERMVYYYLALLLSEVKYNPRFIEKHTIIKTKVKELINEEV